MPNAPAVLIDFANPVKRHAMDPSFGVQEPERLRFVPEKSYLPERHQNNPILNPVKVAQFKIPARETRIPADAVQQFVNGQLAHGHHRLPVRPTLLHSQQNAAMRRELGYKILLPPQIVSQP